MKFLAPVAAFALAMASTHAAECTAETMSSVQSKTEYETLLTACGSTMNSLGTATTNNDAIAAAKKMCEDKTCLNALEAAVKVFPDCTIQGMSFKKTYENQMTTLKTECAKAVGSSAAAAPSMGFSATAAATLAAVVVVAQL